MTTYSIPIQHVGCSQHSSDRASGLRRTLTRRASCVAPSRDSCVRRVPAMSCRVLCGVVLVVFVRVALFLFLRSCNRRSEYTPILRAWCEAPTCPCNVVSCVVWCCSCCICACGLFLFLQDSSHRAIGLRRTLQLYACGAWGRYSPCFNEMDDLCSHQEFT